MLSILILNQDPQDTPAFEWSPFLNVVLSPACLFVYAELLELLRVDVFWGSGRRGIWGSGVSIWPWCHLEDYVRLAMTCKYFAFDDTVIEQCNQIKWSQWWHNEEALIAEGLLIPRTPESPSDLDVHAHVDLSCMQLRGGVWWISGMSSDEEEPM